jgi:hypothetical protein
MDIMSDSYFECIVEMENFDESNFELINTIRKDYKFEPIFSTKHPIQFKSTDVSQIKLVSRMVVLIQTVQQSAKVKRYKISNVIIDSLKNDKFELL